MTDTMREFLQDIKKELDKDPSLLDAPVVSVHSASGAIEGAYAPWVTQVDPDDDEAELYEDVAGLQPGDKYWRVTIDH